MKYIYIIFVLLLFQYGCLPDKKFAIKVTNETSSDIKITPGYGKYGTNPYPDTLLPNEKPSMIFIGAHDYGYIDASFDWESVIQSFPLDTLSIYYFSADSIEYYSWYIVRTKYLVLRRDDFSIEALQKKNWTIKFENK